MPSAPIHVRKAVGLRFKALVHAIAERDETSSRQILADVDIPQSRAANWYAGKNLADPWDLTRFVERHGGTLEWLYRGNLPTIPDAALRKLVSAHHRTLMADGGNLHVA